MQRGRSRSISTVALARQASEERRWSLLVTATSTSSSPSTTTHTTSTSSSKPLSSSPVEIIDLTTSNTEEHPASPTNSSDSLVSSFMTLEAASVSIPPPLTLQDQLHVAYASDDIHLAKILLLKLKGIEVTSDSDPRIAAVQPEDFDECFIPAGGFMSQEDEEVIEEMQRVERERLRVEHELRERREREESEKRRRREWESHCEKIWEGEKKRMREEKQFLEKKREEERKRWEETDRRKREAAERRATATSRYSTRSSLSTSKSKPKLSYANLSTERSAGSSSSLSSMAADDDQYLYSLPVPKVPPPPPRRRRGSASPPSQLTTFSSPYPGPTLNSSTHKLGQLVDGHTGEDDYPSSSHQGLITSEGRTRTALEPLDSESDPHTHLSSSSSTTITVSFRDVLTSMRGPLFPLVPESDSRPRCARADESRDGSQSQSPIRHRTQSRGRCQEQPLQPLSLKSGGSARRRKRDEELLSVLLTEVKWVEGERLLRGRPRQREIGERSRSNRSTEKEGEAGSKEKARQLRPSQPVRQNSSSSIKSCSSTSSCAACSAASQTPTSPTSSTSSAVSRAGSWLSSFSSSSTSTDITTPSTSLSTSPLKANITPVHKHLSSSVPPSNVRSTVAGWLRKSAIAAATQQHQAKESHRSDTQLMHSCHRLHHSRLTRILPFDGPLPLDHEGDGTSSLLKHEGVDELVLKGDTKPRATDPNAGHRISIHGAAGLARQMTRFVELAKGFQTAYINMAAFSALHTSTSYDGRSWDFADDAEEEEVRRRRRTRGASTKTAVRRLRPAGYRATNVEVQLFALRPTVVGVRKEKEGSLGATNEGSAGVLPDDETTRGSGARELRSSWNQENDDEGAEYIPLLSPFPPSHSPRTVLPNPLPYPLFFKPSNPLVLSPHRRVSLQHHKQVEDGMEFGSLSVSPPPYPSLARGTGRFSSRLSSSPPPRSSPRSRGSSRSNSLSPTRRSSLARLQNPQKLPAPVPRPRLVANPVYLRLKAAKNVGHELGVNWEVDLGKKCGSLCTGKEKVLALAYDEIGKSVLGREEEFKREGERERLYILSNYRGGAGVEVERDRRGRHDRQRIPVAQVDGFSGVRRGRCVVRG
ncbi:hypothetical protein PQX77_007135 [Marasmius sp. AFHP31]|nr:hypothetical protein PQX77_007135 [Marasmius sp. AFHP31]